MSSPAISGAGMLLARSFKMTLPGSGSGASSASAMVTGGYAFRASVDAWLKLGGAAVAAAAVSRTAGAAQPDVNATLFLPSGVDVPVDVPPNSTLYFSVIADSTTAGTLYVNGPLANSTGVV